MAQDGRYLTEKGQGKTIENPPGILRTTMAYEDSVMLCHFLMRKGATIPLHNHDAVQSGYVIRGKVRFLSDEGEAFTAEAGTGYLFGSNQRHGAEVLEEAELVECFSPMRPEYAD